MRKEFSEHLATFYWKPVFWSGSYYVASSGGAPIEALKAYIKNQEAPQ
jgi:putative transposase